MPNFEDIIKYINAILQLIFGKNIPIWISTLVGWLLLVGLLLCGVWGLLVVLSKIKDLLVQSFFPLFYDRDKRRLVRRRQTFAKHIEYEILRLDLLEDWKDDRFAELEAEVEAEGERRIFSFIPFLKQTRDGLRREKSLSAALTSSQARFVLIEGSPGGGKSIALRHVTQKMAKHAKKSKSLNSVIPIYVNLKELERAEGEIVDRNLIEAFIKKTLTRINDRDVEQFLDEQFTIGIENGTWFFLFDSFDEIPEILSSSEADAIIRTYGDAIADFLQGGMNTCRGVIASRQFRGPKQFGWPHFHIIELTEDRRLELIRKADFEHNIQEEFINQLSIAPQEIRFMASNPLFLSLLCEHVKGKHPFPKNAHTVFETYVESRLKRDELRLQKRFNLSISQIRICAENVAFCMASDTGLGLSPTRGNLRSSLLHLQTEQDDTFDMLLDALEYTKLARSGTGVEVGQPRSFTFAHRRFQEYFATCVVLRDLTRVSSTQLLTNARWRETTVVIGQTQIIGILSPILQQAEHLLTQFCNTSPQLIDDPIKYIDDKKHGETNTEEQTPYRFPWPAGSLHLLGLLQDGFSSHLEDLPSTIRILASKLILSATEIGGLDDRKLALEIAGVTPSPVLGYLLSKAFLSKSQWLRDVAYQQASHLSKIPPDITKGIHQAIRELMTSGRLNKEKQATKAHLSRLFHAGEFLSTMNLLLHLPFIDTIWGILFLAFTIIIGYQNGIYKSWVEVLVTIFASGLIFISIWTSLAFRFFRFFRTFKLFRSNAMYNTFMILMTIRIFLFISPAIMIGGSGNMQNESLVLSSFSFILSFNFLLTVPIAFYASSTGRYCDWIQWTFIPLYPIIWLTFYNRDNFQSLKKYLYKNIWGILSVSIVTIVLFASIIYIASLLNAQKILIVIVITIFMLFMLFISFNAINYIKNILHDRKKWLIWLGKSDKAINYREFWKIVNSYDTDVYRTRMIKAIREQQLLIATDKAEIFLRKIVRETEKRLQLENSNKMRVIGDKNSKTKWHRSLSWIDPTALDEIGRLLEAIRIFNERNF